MSRPRFRNRPLTDHVPRRGATTHRAGLDPARRLANAEAALQSSIGVDTDELNLYRALGAGVLTYNFDPSICANTTDHATQIGTGYVFMQAVYLPVPATITGVMYYVQTAGVGTWAATGNAVGVYSASGARLCYSANNLSLYKSLGLQTTAVTTGTFDLDRGLYYVALGHNRSATTTAPKLAGRISFASSLANLQTATAFPRSFYMTDTTLSASYTYSSGTLGQGNVWVGLY